MRVVFVHGACVTDGVWWWQPTAAALEDAGVRSVAPLLPSCGETGAPVSASGPGLADDVAAVREVLEAGDEPTVVVAHSYGGIVTAEAAAGVASVTRLLLISSYLPEPGESLSSFGGEEPSPALSVDPEGGTFTVLPDALGPTFLQDCPPELQREAARRTAHQSLSVLEAPVTATAWKDIPTTYLLCARDLGTPATRQRTFAERADTIIELDTGHHPFLSQPAAVRDAVLDRPGRHAR